MEKSTTVSLFVCDVTQVKVSLDGLMESLASLSVHGDCVAAAEHLLKELKTLQESTQVRHTLTHLLAAGYLILD